MIPEDLDLEALARELWRSVGEPRPVGYLRGKSVMRAALVDKQGYSELDAESLIDTMEQRGLLRYLGDPAERSHADIPWKLGP